jgi:hypothetical protein
MVQFQRVDIGHSFTCSYLTTTHVSRAYHAQACGSESVAALVPRLQGAQQGGQSCPSGRETTGAVLNIYENKYIHPCHVFMVFWKSTR